jgi:nucleoside-diphosphate-sugar epimerase
MNRLVVTGATGNTGSEVLKKFRALSPTLEILALIRPSSETSELRRMGISVLECDLNNASTYQMHLHSSDTVLEMANLRFFKALRVAINTRGIQRAFFVTTTGVFSTFHSYAALYREIESEMRQSAFGVTILRPSMIYGNERDHNMHKLLSFLNKTPVFPVFGDGTSLMQPVHVEDLATGIVTAVTQNIVGEFNLAGPEPISYNSLLETSASALGKKIRFLHLPHKIIANLVAIAEKIPRFPIKHEQVMRLQENKNFDISKSIQLLNYAPRAFAVGIQQEISRLKELKKL